MKTVQMTIDEDLIAQVDRAARRLKTTRSGFTRQALRDALKRLWRCSAKPGIAVATPRTRFGPRSSTCGLPSRCGRSETRRCALVSFSGADKRRPVVILTRDSILEYLAEVTIAPITSTVRDIPTEVVLGPSDGLPRACAINLDHVQTVPKARIGGVVTTLTSARMHEVRDALLFALGYWDRIGLPHLILTPC